MTEVTRSAVPGHPLRTRAGLAAACRVPPAHYSSRRPENGVGGDRANWRLRGQASIWLPSEASGPALRDEAANCPWPPGGQGHLAPRLRLSPSPPPSSLTAQRLETMLIRGDLLMAWGGGSEAGGG